MSGYRKSIEAFRKYVDDPELGPAAVAFIEFCEECEKQDADLAAQGEWFIQRKSELDRLVAAELRKRRKFI